MLRMTILGCGSSGGVPRVGGDWGGCDPLEPKNRRTRCSILIEQWEGDVEPPTKARTTILIDSSPDLREQLLGTQTQHLDALLFTHEHADQIHGIDDVRSLAYRMARRIPTYMDGSTKTIIAKRFEYLFKTPKGRVHPPILDLQPILSGGDVIHIDGPGGRIKVRYLSVSHGPTRSGGFIFNDVIAYTPDVWDIDKETLTYLNDIHIWVIDALRYNEHPTHAHADKALSWIAASGTRQAILTNLHIDMDYQTLSAELPGQHLVAYDGLQISVNNNG